METIRQSMKEPIYSPDGKWIWNGDEWIPIPPTSAQPPKSNINLQDSMMSGNVNIEQNSPDVSSGINLKDSAMSGDINITQNNSSDFIDGIEHLLRRIGIDNVVKHSVEMEHKSEAEAEDYILEYPDSDEMNYILCMEDFAHQRLIDTTRLRKIFGLQTDNRQNFEPEVFEIPLRTTPVEYTTSGNIDSGIIGSLTSSLDRLDINHETWELENHNFAWIICLETFMSDCGVDIPLLRARFNINPKFEW
jgi:hypothetical protein